MPNQFEVTAKAIKEIVALGDCYINELNKELSSCNITVHYKTAQNLDYDNPANTSQQTETGNMKK